MLFLEGMDKFGQQFIYKIHITAESLTSTNARPKIARFNPKSLNVTDYTVRHWMIDEHQGVLLLKSVEDEMKKGIDDFSVAASYGSKNCLKWAINHLRDIGVKADISTFTLPSRAAGGARFL